MIVNESFRWFEHAQILRKGGWQNSLALAVCLVFGGFAAAQDVAPAAPTPGVSLPAPVGPLLGTAFPRVPGVKSNDAPPLTSGSNDHPYNGTSLSTSNPSDASTGVRRITLDEAQQMAAGASNPLVRLGQLSVEAAKQHRLGVEGLYFPNISTQFANLHLNKATGEVLSVPSLGVSVPVKIFGKDETDFNVAAAQPVTPLFSIYQLVKIARADENIAKAKAGLPVAEVAGNVEKNYFDLLVAERELVSSEADAKKIQTKWLSASSSATPIASAEQESEMLGAEKAVVLSSSKVDELTASLDETLGLPEGTKLELVPPEPLVEDISLTEAAEKATAASPEVVEAEQTAIKAHAGLALTKLAYVPTVALTGGYANQNTVNSRLLPKDFGYIGVVASFTLFDGLKREHGVKEVKAQAEMADLAVQLSKAKAAAGVKSSYLELERSRQLAQLARRMVTASEIVNASYKPDDPEIESARAKMEADMFRAELEYRQAYGRLKNLLGH